MLSRSVDDVNYHQQIEHNKSYSDPTPRKNESFLIKSKVSQSNKIMICGSEKSNIDLIRRFMNQLKNCTIVTGSASGIERDVYNNSAINNIECNVNKDYCNIKENSTRLYYIYMDEKPSKVYIIDDEYEDHIERYNFINFINKHVEIIIIKTFHYH